VVLGADRATASGTRRPRRALPAPLWLSDEWFTADGTTGVAIPFYLAHPRLARLEESQMLEVEGGTPEWCTRILRHETGHAIDNAYRLQRRRRRQELFGRSSDPYPEDYTPRPYSRSFVVNLESWYPQSHPSEDFAETFAVWMTPDAQRRTQHAGWPALPKLECLVQLMREIGAREPVVGPGKAVDPLMRIRRTLRTHYQRKRAKYGVDYPDFSDRDLRRLFSDDPWFAGNVSAVAFLGRIRREVRRRVARYTGEKQYTIDQVIEKAAHRQTGLPHPEPERLRAHRSARRWEGPPLSARSRLQPVARLRRGLRRGGRVRRDRIRGAPPAHCRARLRCRPWQAG